MRTDIDTKGPSTETVDARPDGTARAKPYDRWPGLDGADLWKASVGDMHRRIDATFETSRERVVADVRSRPVVEPQG